MMQITGRLRAVGRRLYADYLLPDRAGEYAALLRAFAEHGYSTATIEQANRRIANGESLPDRLLVLRHDLDSDPAYSDEWMRIEKSVGFTGSYYFRLRTADREVMRRIADDGAEVGYHFEEVASYAKAAGLTTEAEIRAHFPQIRARFLDNLTRLRAYTGLLIATAASHGDFLNRRLGVTNEILLQDADFRRQAGISLEAYDSGYLDKIAARVSDHPQPKPWLFRTGRTFEEMIAAGEGPIEILTHPRHWRTSRYDNFREDSLRLASDLLWRSRISGSWFADFADRRGHLPPAT